MTSIDMNEDFFPQNSMEKYVISCIIFHFFKKLRFWLELNMIMSLISITKKHHKTTFIGQNFSVEKNYLPSNDRESQHARFWRIVNRAIKMIKGCHFATFIPQSPVIHHICWFLVEFISGFYNIVRVLNF